MRLRFALGLALGSLSTLACAGRATTSGAGGSAATSATGSSSAGDEGILGAPKPITTSPAILGPSPVKCDGIVTPEPPIVRACVLAASCSPFPDVALSDCIASDLPDSGALPACVVGAQSCAEIDACLGTGFYPDPCQADDPAVICVGTKIIHCSDTPRDFKDCAKQGAFCAPYSSNDDGTLDAADCAVTKKCNQASDVFVCEGTKRVLCHQGVGFGEDCAARGLGCVDQPDGAVCAATKPSCDQPGAGSCGKDGNGTYCDVDGRTLPFACDRLGFTCAEAPLASYGVACTDPTCSTEDAAQCSEECDGPMAYLCLGGHRFSIDCRSYGLPACRLETYPDAGDRARCGLF